jgi:hypothetical protein
MEEYHQITLDEWTKWREEIRQKLQEAAGNFVYIGYRLKQIRDSGMYDGKADFFEWAEQEYGLSKSTVSRFIAINEKFADPDNRLELKPEYRALGSSKLSEMLTLPDNECELITEQTTVKEIRELKALDRQAPEEGEEHLYTPLQLCIIDFFKNKLDLLETISGMLDEKEIAEAMSPSGYTAHKKGLVFLFMYDYEKGVKYKLAGNTIPIAMTWEEFYDEIHYIFFDWADDYKLHLKDIYPKDDKNAENAVKMTENAENCTEKDEKRTENHENGNDNTETHTEAPTEKAEPVAAEQPEIVADQKADGTLEPVDSVATSQQKAAALYDETLRLIDKLRAAFEVRKWDQALDGINPIRWKIQTIINMDQALVDNALDALMED